MSMEEGTTEISGDLETLLTGLQTDYKKAKEIDNKGHSADAAEYMGALLTPSKQDELSKQLLDYMSKVDEQMKSFNDQISELCLWRNYGVRIQEIQRELKILFSGKYGEEERLISVSGYVSDKDLYFSNRDITPIPGLLPLIYELKQSHNYALFRNEDKDREFELYSRVKKDVPEKLLRYIFEENDFPRDFGGNRLIFQRSRHLYTFRDMLRQIASNILEEDYRNLPEYHDDNVIRRNTELAMEIGSKNQNPTEEERQKMIVGIWVDFEYNGVLMEMQLMTDRGSTIIKTHPTLRHENYKENTKRTHQGIERVMEKFVRDSSSDLLKPVNYKEQRELAYSEQT